MRPALPLMVVFWSVTAPLSMGTSADGPEPAYLVAYRILANPTSELEWTAALTCEGTQAAIVVALFPSTAASAFGQCWKEPWTVAVQTDAMAANFPLPPIIPPGNLTWTVGGPVALGNLPGPEVGLVYAVVSSKHELTFTHSNVTILEEMRYDGKWLRASDYDDVFLRVTSSAVSLDASYAWEANYGAIVHFYPPPPVSPTVQGQLDTPEGARYCRFDPSFGCSIYYTGGPGDYRLSYAAQMNLASWYFSAYLLDAPPKVLTL